MKMTFKTRYGKSFEVVVRFAFFLDDVEYIYKTEEEALEKLQSVFDEKYGKVYPADREPYYNWSSAKSSNSNMVATYNWAYITEKGTYKTVSKNIRIVGITQAEYWKRSQEIEKKEEEKRRKKACKKAKKDNAKLKAELKAEREANLK